MSHLVLVGDAAYPQNVDNLPKEMAAFCGYIGGDTPHVWTTDEVNAVLNKGLMWWPIYTAPSSPKTVNGATVWPKLTATMGTQHGHDTLVALSHYPMLSQQYPVFNDIEYGTFEADPQGAVEYLAAWKEVLKAAGRTGWGYLPWKTQIDWVANWTNIRPTVLPVNCVGWQFGGLKDAQKGLDMDLSIFDLDKIGVANAMQDININTISPAAAHAIAVAMLEVSPSAINGYNGRVADILTGDATSLTQILGELQSLNANIQALTQALTGGKPSGQGG